MRLPTNFACGMASRTLPGNSGNMTNDFSLPHITTLGAYARLSWQRGLSLSGKYPSLVLARIRELRALRDSLQSPPSGLNKELRSAIVSFWITPHRDGSSRIEVERNEVVEAARADTDSRSLHRGRHSSPVATEETRIW